MYTSIRKFAQILCHNAFRCIAAIFVAGTKIKNNRIMFSSYAFTRYACNPKYISDYLNTYHNGEFELIWCFKKNLPLPKLPENIIVVRKRSLKYFYYLATSKILISNVRLGDAGWNWVKRRQQKYILTWHSSMGIKMVEADAKLSPEYIHNAKIDSKRCDLILSGCKLRTDIILRSFWYNGEVLKEGTPRNDLLFHSSDSLKHKIYKKYGIESDSKILLYAPTFRDDYGLDTYKFEWTDVIEALREKYGEKYTVMIRLHPNFYAHNIVLTLPSADATVVDVTGYEDMQELLRVADILVTDYSSSIFDFALLNKPVFLFANDIGSYNRGSYLDLTKLPFPLATDNAGLLHSILTFDIGIYRTEVKIFNEEVLGTYERGKACEGVYKWIIAHQTV